MYPYITDFIFQTPTCRVRSGQVGLVGIGRDRSGIGRERSGKVGKGREKSVSFMGGPLKVCYVVPPQSSVCGPIFAVLSS